MRHLHRARREFDPERSTTERGTCPNQLPDGVSRDAMLEMISPVCRPGVFPETRSVPRQVLVAPRGRVFRGRLTKEIVIPDSLTNVTDETPPV